MGTLKNSAIGISSKPMSETSSGIDIFSWFKCVSSSVVIAKCCVKKAVGAALALRMLLGECSNPVSRCQY